jgi:hypothetical protein
MKNLVIPLALSLLSFLAGASVDAAPPKDRPPIVRIWQRAGENIGPSQWTAQWIWCRGVEEGRNLFCLARKRVVLERPPQSAILHVTADSHYQVWINGRHVNRGPARCLPEYQAYDILDVTDLLHAGNNVVAVLAQHYGATTSGYVLGKPGLLAQLEVRLDNRVQGTMPVMKSLHVGAGTHIIQVRKGR